MNVGDSETITRKLWSEAALKVLPGAYLGRADADGWNPGAGRMVQRRIVDVIAPQRHGQNKGGQTKADSESLNDTACQKLTEIEPVPSGNRRGGHREAFSCLAQRFDQTGKGPLGRRQVMNQC